MSTNGIPMAVWTALSDEQKAAVIAAMSKAREEAAAEASLKALMNRKLTYKVSEKGALSVYGLQSRFPVTLYKSQWEKLLADMDNLKAALTQPGLKVKGE